MNILPIIPYSQLTLEQDLAKTAHADVHLSTWQRAQVVVKEFRLIRMTADGQAEFVKEAQITAQLSHPHVVRLFGICNEPSHYCLVIEYVAKGALQTLLESAEPLTWKTRLQIGCDMTLGLAYLHDQKILHRDMKSGNVLIDAAYRAKLTDFGQAKVKSEALKNSSVRGTLAWSPPELFEEVPMYSEKSDVYALGMTLWELASRQTPYVGLTEPAIMRKIDRGETPLIPSGTPPLLTSLIQACWMKDPSQRPSAPRVLEALDKIPLPNDPPITSTVNPVQPAQTVAPSGPIAISSSSKPASVPSTPNLAFGAAQWKTHFGDIGVEPPLPLNIHEILKAPCPFWSGKTVGETHLLTLVPATVDGKPFCLDQLRELIQHPKQGPATDYRYYSDLIKTEDKQRAPATAYWVLLTRDVLPDTRNKIFQDQKQKVDMIGKGYELPGLLEVATSVLMEHVRSGKRLYGDNPWTETRCQEIDKYGNRCLLGGFSASGVSVSFSHVDVRNESFGVGVRRKF